MGKLEPMLKPYRRHTADCKYFNAESSWEFLNCKCPLWAYGETDNGKVRRSLKTRDLQRAMRKIARMDAPDSPDCKPIAEAVKAFRAKCSSLEPSTQRKYFNVIGRLEEYCQAKGYDEVGELTVEILGEFCDAREIARTTAIRELQTLRLFFSFCAKRKWIAQNIASELDTPKARPSEIVPYTDQEKARILAAASVIGRNSYERLRARAMVLLLRHTALRVSDVALLERRRIEGQQILLYTKKSGGQVYLPLPSELIQALEHLPPPKKAPEDCPYYFWNGTTSKRAVVGIAERTLSAVFAKSGVEKAHAHRFRHSMATEILSRGGSEQDVADVLGISPAMVRKHYAKWNQARQNRINAIMAIVQGTAVVAPEASSAKTVVN